MVMANEHLLRELNAPLFGHIAATLRDARGYFLRSRLQPNRTAPRAAPPMADREI